MPHIDSDDAVDIFPLFKKWLALSSIWKIKHNILAYIRILPAIYTPTPIARTSDGIYIIDLLVQKCAMEFNYKIYASCICNILQLDSVSLAVSY